MNRRDLARAVSAFPAGFGALHTLPAPAQAKLRQLDAVSEPAASWDAALLAACRDFHDTKGEEARCLAADDVHEADVLSWGKRLDAALRAAAELPARTPEGLRAKAQLVLAMLPAAVEEFSLSTDSDEILVVLSLARDLLTQTKRDA
jgi:hypothetical protein